MKKQIVVLWVEGCQPKDRLARMGVVVLEDRNSVTIKFSDGNSMRYARGRIRFDSPPTLWERIKYRKDLKPLTG